MEFIHLAASHSFGWFPYLAFTVGIAVFLVDRRHATQAHQIQNLNALTRHHWEMWVRILDDADLARIPDPKANVQENSVTFKEAFHVKFLLLHLYAAFQASKRGMFVPAETLAQDIAQFLTLPVPQAVWKQLRDSQDKDFRAFVDHALAGGTKPPAP